MNHENKQDAPISVFDMYTIGVGPSSSHTIGPMSAAYRFTQNLQARGCLANVARILVELFGSLALTGKGHATDRAILVGLSGEQAHLVAPEKIPEIVQTIRTTQILQLAGHHGIAFNEADDLKFHYKETLPQHSNGMRFTALDPPGNPLLTCEYFSVGGGFIIGDGLEDAVQTSSNILLPYPYETAEDLLQIGDATSLRFADVAIENESAWRNKAETCEYLDKVYGAMMGSIDRACQAEGILPGGLKVKRRAACMFNDLMSKPHAGIKDPLTALDWVNLYALAVNEENAAGGRVVTAPTNGAAGVIPAVLRYYMEFITGADKEGAHEFLLVASLIGSLYKKRASISAAEVGCQGEVGVACSMAAGALASVMGGTNRQIENAAEIGMEHNLGLTCDPIGGLVQIPCIERNTMGAVKAINAARLALKGDGYHFVSLDAVIQTMHQTGKDMMSKYKETSEGGLAVNAVMC